VKPFDVAEAFVEQHAHGVSLPELRLAFEKSLQALALCSVVPDSGVIEPGAYQAIFTMACFMFDAMLQVSAQPACSETRAMQFSERERQCLELAAQGKDDWSIGSLLRISERTAHNHIERAKRRLGVCTRVQVIVHALSDGQISFGDVIKADPRRKAN
jgi:DNA-binding CsgD family transcriptional regulator